MIKLREQLRNNRLQAIVDDIGQDGIVKLYTGVPPTTVGGAGQNATPLGSLQLSTVAGSVSGGILTFNPISPDVEADNSGRATWGEVRRTVGGSSGAVLIFDVGTTSTNAVLKFTDTLFVQGDTLDIKSFVMTEGNA